jgi:CubicO group peptidase (beta-lactamase class C family)
LLDEVIPRLLERAAAEGVYVSADCAVLLNGKNVHRSGVGAAKMFDVASLTKALCTAPLAWGFLAGDAEAETMLHHRAGFPAWRPYFEQAPAFREADTSPDGLGAGRDLVRRLARNEARTERERVYSDVGYIVLGARLEERGGAPLDALFAERISAPLGARETFFVDWTRPEEARARIAGRVLAPTGTHRPRPRNPGGTLAPAPREDPPGACDDDNAYAMGGVAGHAGLFSTADDVARLAWELMERRPDTPGWDDGPTGSGGARGHLGFTGCSVWVWRERALSVALLTNRVWPDRSNERIKPFRAEFHAAVLKELAA